MASDQEIVNGIESLLRQSNPNAVSSISGIVQQLEAKLGLDLSHKAGFIRDLLSGGGTGAGNGGYRFPPPSQIQPKDHFALQHFPSHFQPTTSSQQFPSHFALPHHHHQYHNHHPEELNFRYSQPQQQPHLYQYPPQQQHSRQNAIPQPGRPEAFFVGEPEIIKKESVPVGTKRRGGPGGLNKVCGVSPELQAIVGEPALPRTQIVKQLWAYIRKHNLQDPSNKRKIICNDALRLVFETDCTDMFKMNKLLAKHIIPLDPTKEPGPDASPVFMVAEEPGPDAKRLKIETESATEDTQAASEITTEATSESDSPTVTISDALANLFGTKEKGMTQSEAVRRLWDYIKINQLEDELNPMTITCDSKLQQLFGSENVSALDIAELLMTHFLKS